MNLIQFLARQSWPWLLFAAFAGILGGVSGAGLVTVIGEAISGPGPRAGMAWLFFGLCVTVVGAKVSSSLCLIKLSQAATLELRIGLSGKLLGTPYKKLQGIGKAELLGILTSDIVTFTQAFQSIPLVFCDAVLVLMCLGYMAWLSWQLLLMFVLVLGLSMLAYHLAETIPLRRMRELRQKMDIVFKNFRNLVEGTKELQLNAQRRTYFIDEVIARDARQFSRLFVSAMNGYTWLGNVGAMMFFLIIGVVVFVLPAWIPLAAPTVTKFVMLLMYLIGPISNIMLGLPQLRQAAISLNKIAQLDGVLGGQPMAVNAAAPAPAPFAAAAPLVLEFQGVCHHYRSPGDDSRFMLGPLDLHIRQGEILFIVGGNGSGKTTLAMLLLGLYEPEAGRIVLNGTAVSAANIASYRSHFSAVFADFHLFEEVIGHDDATLALRANDFVAKFGMAHKVNVADGKFSTLALSTGQRKRLALVSAYLEDRPVVLFDEWAADQDPVFKRVFYTEVLPDLQARGKTVLIITHDDAYFPYADRIVKLADGQLHEVAPATYA